MMKLQILPYKHQTADTIATIQRHIAKEIDIFVSLSLIDRNTSILTNGKRHGNVLIYHSIKAFRLK